MSISNVYPAVTPTLLLDFENTRVIDLRFNFSRPTISATTVGTALYYDGTTYTKAEENLLIYSQVFNNVAWTATDMNVSLNTDISPDGSTTASTISSSNVNATLTQVQNLGPGTYTFSVWIKRSLGTGNIDLTVDSAGTWSTVTITSSWARYTVTQTLGSAGNKNPGIRIATGGDEIIIWGAQLENRNATTSYTLTTTDAITNTVPTLVSAAQNVPRIEHVPSSGRPLGLLIEQNSTNLLTYSSDFSNVIWNKTNCSIESASTIAPDGTLTSNKIYINNVNLSDVFNFYSITTLAATFYGISVYAKANEFQYLFVGFNTSATEFAVAQFNLLNGTVQFQGASGTNYLVGDVSIANVGNGWFKCQLILQTGNTTENLMISPSNIPWTGSARPGTGLSGNGFSGVQVWGAQLEENTLTSYIPTTSTTITRSADNLTQNNIASYDWFNSSLGAFVVTTFVNVPINKRTIISVDDDTTDNSLTLYALNQVNYWESKVLNVTQANINGGLMVRQSKNITSVKYKNNDYVISLNNFAAVTDTGGKVPLNLTHCRIGSDKNGNYLNGIISRIAYYYADISASQLNKLSSK